MLKICSNPEIRAESGGFSALDQVNDKVTPARLPKFYTIGCFPMLEVICRCKSLLPLRNSLLVDVATHKRLSINDLCCRESGCSRVSVCAAPSQGLRLHHPRRLRFSLCLQGQAGHPETRPSRQIESGKSGIIGLRN